jgi:hypothetical protein
MSGIGIGEVIDISIGSAPVDLLSGAVTGKRLNMQGVENVTILVNKGVGTTTQDPVLTLQQHTLSAAGTSTNLVAISNYYTKTGAPSLLGSEVWTAVSQTNAATITLTGNAVNQMLIAIPVPSEALSSTTGWISLNIASTAATQIVSVSYLLRSDDRRVATAMPAPLR